MNKKSYLILAINPGSTSTKIAVFRDGEQLHQQVIRHEPEDFKDCPTILDQKDVRTAAVMRFLDEAGIDPAQLDAVVGRGGLLKPIASGTYAVNDAMLVDLQKGSAGSHASSLGGTIAAEIGRQYGKPAFIVDPVVVDEREPIARYSGIPAIERRSVFHALNQKAICRQAAADLGKPYDGCRFIAVHMGGGISVGAHKYGRVIDVNDALNGEGPFSPERCGSVPLIEVIEMCYSGEHTKGEMLGYLNKNGGMLAYIGTNSLIKAEEMIADGDETAKHTVDAMAYQVAKEIGAMSTVLKGQVDAIVLTGGLAYSERFVASIADRVRHIADVMVYPGEDEMAALVGGAIRVLSGEEPVSEYR